MKNKYYLLLAVAFFGIRAGAESFVSGDMTYITTSANTVELSMCNLKEGEVKIPATVEYGGTLYTVTSIGNDVFKKHIYNRC